MLSVVIKPSLMFKNYLYVSGTTETFRNHCGELAKDAVARVKRKRIRVLDIACNDGTQLEFFKELGCDVYGVDPAENLREITVRKNIPVIVDYWSKKIIQKLGKKFNLITGTNVFAHVDRIDKFLAACSLALEDDGILILEFPYGNNMITYNEFDTIYHEHLSYFRVEVLDRLFQSEGLLLFDAERIPLHGGSLKVFIGHPNGPHERTARVGELIAFERERDLGTIAPYQAFALRVAAVRERTLEFLRGLHDAGTHIAGYGAAAKGNVFLNYCQVGPDLIEFIADRSPHKQGRFTPRNHIPVVAPEEILRRMPDILVIFAWNFADEIIFQQSEYRQRGGKFAMLLLEPRVIL